MHFAKKSLRLRSNRGVTLIEMMIAIAVLGIIIRLAAPSFSSFVADSRLTANSQSLAAAFNYARNEAAMAGAPVRVIANSSDWSQGAIIQNIAGTTLRQVNALSGSVVLNGGISGISTIIFYPDGSTSINSSTPWLRFCDNRSGVAGRVIMINGSGFISVYPTLSSGGSGANAVCS